MSDIDNHELKIRSCDELIDKVKILDKMLDDYNNYFDISEDIRDGFIDVINKYKASPNKQLIIGLEHFDEEDVIRYIEMDKNGINIATRFAENGSILDTSIHCHDPKRMIFQYAEITNKFGYVLKNSVIK